MVIAAEPEQNGPTVVPDRLQQLAQKFPIAENLKINWDSATPSDVGRYVGFLAAVNVVATEIANKNDRKFPNDEDYIAAISIQCMFPPNKPPLVKPYWDLLFPAFYDEATRNKLKQAVQAKAFDLANVFAKPEVFSDFENNPSKFLPSDQKTYFDTVFDPTILKK
jgi:hypothetical protein